MASSQQGSLGPPASCKDSPTNGQGGRTAGSSPLNAELLVAARKGNTDQVERCLGEGGGAGAATTDKVSILNAFAAYRPIDREGCEFVLLCTSTEHLCISVTVRVG